MIAVVQTIDDVRRAVRSARRNGKTIGFVPTMGALHSGHVHLVETSKSESGFTLVSIFVNPTQFGPSEDFQKYPRTLDDDCRKCAGAGADLVFAPAVEEIYPDGPVATFVEVPGLGDRFEGASRPGHFRGVATVVLKLFQIVQPDRAYFGQKDYQQQLLIRRMVRDLNSPVEIRTVPTVREADGLAMSSRNRYLAAEERAAARILWTALQEARRGIAEGEQDADRVRQILVDTVKSEPLARLDYAEIADADSLDPLDRLTPSQRAVALLAVRVGTTRLIDNSLLAE